jgi:2,3-dihydro-2,3-dihydroxybenzoate dehydrogenase
MERQAFADRVALVTGAGGGIGEAVSRQLASAGATVVVTDANAESARAVAESIGAAGGRAHGFALDVSDRARVEALVAQVEQEIGPIEVLVNVAGIFTTARLVDTTDEAYDRIMGVNAGGVFACLRAVGRRMIPRGRGAVVTVASQSCKVVRVDQAAYGASKAAAEYLTKCLGLELAEHGIRCNVVHPGVTETPLARKLWASGASSKDAHLTGNLARYRIGVPLRKVGQPDDVAAAVVFLASDAASHITMQDILVDGGQTLAAR